MPFQFDNTYVRLPSAFFTPVEPTPVSAPTLIGLNRELAAELGLDIARLDSPEGLAILSGNERPDGAEPLAMAYSGHQFGGFAGQLGDGRAILLGEVVDKNGVRRDIQLKGSGLTPFSRRGDGRSALGPVLREYIVSEAMAALGVPTTRALAAVASGEQVARMEMEPGGVFTRVAQSHIRVGTFEHFASRQEDNNLRILADYAIDRHYPDARKAENPYRALLESVIERQARLVAHWMQLGFIHGVMNTDNTAISGETIDYGPCAFMDDYDPTKVFSSIDQQGRYAYGNQGQIAHWNLTRLAESLLPLLADNQEDAIAEAEAELKRYPALFQSELQSRFTAKIGLEGGATDDWNLVKTLLAAMDEEKADFTQAFRHLPTALESNDDKTLSSLFDDPGAITAWLDKWRARMSAVDPNQAIALMRRTNPIRIPRNHRVEEAIQAGNQGDFEPFHRLNQALRHPFEDRSEFADYEAAPKPDEVVEATFCGT